MNLLYMCEASSSVLIEFFHYLVRDPTFTTLDNFSLSSWYVSLKKQNVQHMIYFVLNLQTHPFWGKLWFMQQVDPN